MRYRNSCYVIVRMTLIRQLPPHSILERSLKSLISQLLQAQFKYATHRDMRVLVAIWIRYRQDDEIVLVEQELHIPIGVGVSDELVTQPFITIT